MHTVVLSVLCVRTERFVIQGIDDYVELPTPISGEGHMCSTRRSIG